MHRRGVSPGNAAARRDRRRQHARGRQVGIVAGSCGTDLSGLAAGCRCMNSFAHYIAIRIRWRIFTMLFGFGFVAYLQQKSITVTAARMMPELHLSQVQIGWIEEAFVIGYALFQLPGGVFGQRIGARRTFVIIGIGAFLAVVGTPLAPFWLSGWSLFAA